MTDLSFALDLLIAGAALLAVVGGGRLIRRIGVPPSALVLVATIAASTWIPGWHRPGVHPLQRIVTVALIAVLLSGGMHIGRARFSVASRPILALGVVGTLATAAAGGAIAHGLFDLSWYQSLIVATALAPTDPAVVFSVLGRRQVAGRAGTVVEGESGANDPVGIALMAGLLGAKGPHGAGALGWGEAGHALGVFAVQMGIGGAIGAVAGLALAALARRVELPSPSLYPVATVGAGALVYGAAATARGSGFLAVFVAGILAGDAVREHRPDVIGFHSALAGLGEIVAFVAAGLTIDGRVVTAANVWGPGLALGAILGSAVRPAVVWACLRPVELSVPERRFVQLAGLKGAVPLLLGMFVLSSRVAGGSRAYGIVAVAVLLSIVVQGGLAGPAIDRLGLAVEGA